MIQKTARYALKKEAYIPSLMEGPRGEDWSMRKLGSSRLTNPKEIQICYAFNGGKKVIEAYFCGRFSTRLLVKGSKKLQNLKMKECRLMLLRNVNLNRLISNTR